MKVAFLRNCNSKAEYDLFRSIDSAYFEQYITKIIDTIQISDEDYLALTVNTRHNFDFFNEFIPISYINKDNIALAIKISSSLGQCIVVLNGHNYARYIAF